MFRTFASLGLFLFLSTQLLAQSDIKLDQLPGFSRYEKVGEVKRKLAALNRIENPKWSEDGKSLSYTVGEERRKLDLSSGKSTKIDKEQEPASAETRTRSGGGRRGGARVERAKQRTTEPSPDGKWKATYRDFNVWLEAEGSTDPIAVTKDGSERHRYGTCCWVYGEELDQNDAMWWSPDSQWLAYYEVDEKDMKDYHLTLENTSLYTSLQSVRYPKAGEPNPHVSLWIYHLPTQKSRRIEIEGEPMQYLYGISFAPKGATLLVHRTGRRQDKLDLLAVNAESLKVTTVVSETQSTWQSNRPLMQFLEDGQTFIWETEQTGWKHYQLRNLDGKLLNPLSQVADYPCQGIQSVDEKACWLYYTACSDANPYNVQLHRVKLDGSQHQRITSSPLNHTSFQISPNHDYVLATREQFDTPPASVVYGTQGKEVAILHEGTRQLPGEKLADSEFFSFLSADGKTTIYGTLLKPSDFDPQKKYPLLIDVYGGPSSQGLSNRFNNTEAICELGFLVAKIGNRGTVARGKAFESATYLKLGGPDLEDQADGVRYLSKRPYVDGKRVGIYGHSYGGYMSALALLKYPEVFHAAVAGAPVTDWRNYDSIYTERYMRTPQENGEGYDQGSCMKYIDQFRGKLFLVHGLIDDNVHPANTFQLSKALHGANKRFDMMIYPEFQHGIGSTYGSLRWEYLYRHLMSN